MQTSAGRSPRSSRAIGWIRGRLPRHWPVGCRLRVAVLGLLAASLAPSAYAQSGSGAGLVGFRTPSGNIHCMLEQDVARNGGTPAVLRCDIRQISGAVPARPASCDLDWGQAFAVGQTASTGELLCAGDTVANDELPQLSYGSVWQHLGFTCTSEVAGLTCFNAKRHGFTLSRASRRVF